MWAVVARLGYLFIWDFYKKLDGLFSKLENKMILAYERKTLKLLFYYTTEHETNNVLLLIACLIGAQSW